MYIVIIMSHIFYVNKIKKKEIPLCIVFFIIYESLKEFYNLMLASLQLKYQNDIANVVLLHNTWMTFF